MQEILNGNTDWLSQYVIPWGINIAIALAIFVVGRFVARIIVKSVGKVMERANVEVSLREFLGNILNAALLVVIVIAALEQLGVDTTSVVAIFAAAGLAVGYWSNLQELRKNWAVDKTWQPKMAPETRQMYCHAWKKPESLMTTVMR